MQSASLPHTNMAADALRVSSAHRFARVTGALVALAGCLVLGGWLLDSPVLKSLIPGLVAMNPITAATFVLAAVSLWWSAAEPGDRLGSVWRRRAAFAAAALVALVGALTLVGYLSGTDPRVDQLLFRSKLAGNRIAPNTALNFLLSGAALVFLDAETRGGRRPAQFLALSTAAVSLLVLTGYAYGAHALYGVAAYIPMALNTALAFALLSAGMFAARLDRGMTAVVMGDNTGSVVARRLLPAVVIVPFLLGMATLAGQRARLYDAPFGVSLLVVVSIATLTALIWWNAWALHGVDLARRAAEDAVRRSEREAERANHAKSEFLSRMSHELRTPLNAILGFAQLLEMDRLTGEQRDNVHQILTGGKHLLDLINEVLDLARIEAGRLSVSVEPVAVQEVVQESLDLIVPLGVEKGVRFEGSPRGAPDWHVLADRQRLKQVLLNLLANAVKYNRSGGAVTLAYAVTAVGRLRVEVRDTGPGIPAEKLGHVFTPFERLGAERSGVEGTGLGLALSKRLVEAMGGTVGVDSRVGHGSTFWVEFPMVDAPLAGSENPAAAPPAPASPDGGQPSRCILYIEDNPSNVKLVERLLVRRPAIRLLSVMQGGLGLSLARQHRPDLILLDLHLPDIPGDEVLRRLQGDPQTRGIPVVVISADATRRRVQQLTAAGAREFLTKPLDVARFLAVLDDILSNGAR